MEKENTKIYNLDEDIVKGHVKEFKTILQKSSSDLSSFEMILHAMNGKVNRDILLTLIELASNSAKMLIMINRLLSTNIQSTRPKINR